MALQKTMCFFVSVGSFNGIYRDPRLPLKATIGFGGFRVLGFRGLGVWGFKVFGFRG